MRTLLVSPLNSFPLNPSQVFFTNLTLSINYSLNLLRILRVAPEEIMVRLRIHKIERPWSGALYGPAWVRRFTTSAYTTREQRGCRLFCSRSMQHKGPGE